ncbi:hypothetical protein FRB90_012440 [Tulasnella sp. 427]|nr:hypothetical protein FRB90_012440 [Tulasnella sp. 427]
MASWPSRPEQGGDNGYHDSQTAYANVPTSPSPMDNLHPPVRSPGSSSNNVRGNYVSSPLNPNAATGPGPRSRPGSWGPQAALEPGRTGASSSSDNSQTSLNAKDDKDTIRNVVTGAVGGGYGPYANVRGSFAPPAHNRFSTLSSVGSVVSLTTDSKYPSMYFPNSNTPVQGGFFPYSDTPHIDYATNSFTPDDDDALHDPDPRKMNDGMGPMNWRGVLNLSLVFLIVVALLALFAGYPIISYFAHDDIYFLGNNVWPAAWTMGNLGRPGYGATTDGTWPYTYNSCDVGVLPNQTRADMTPEAAQTSGKTKTNGVLSYLPGQRVSACTCPGEDHPGPDVSVGRSAPEIDVFEAERSKTGGPGGQTSQSSQYAPFNDAYQYNTAATTLYLPTTYHNTFLGSGTQQSISSLTDMDETWFENSATPTYATYGLEFYGDDKNPQNGFINWVAGGQRSWGLTADAFGADTLTEISQRTVSTEPMSIILNLGISEGFQAVDTSTLTLPAHLRFDYVRVYQRKGQTSVGCDPDDHPTAKYINDHIEAYTNANLTFWKDAGFSFPRNSQKDGPC